MELLSGVKSQQCNRSALFTAEGYLLHGWLNTEFVFSTTSSTSSFLAPLLRKNHSEKHRLRVTVAQIFAFLNVTEFDMACAMCSGHSAHAYISYESHPIIISPTLLAKQVLADNYNPFKAIKQFHLVSGCAHS